MNNYQHLISKSWSYYYNKNVLFILEQLPTLFGQIPVRKISSLFNYELIHYNYCGDKATKVEEAFLCKGQLTKNVINTEINIKPNMVNALEKFTDEVKKNIINQIIKKLDLQIYNNELGINFFKYYSKCKIPNVNKYQQLKYHDDPKNISIVWATKPGLYIKENGIDIDLFKSPADGLIFMGNQQKKLKSRFHGVKFLNNTQDIRYSFVIFI